MQAPPAPIGPEPGSHADRTKVAKERTAVASERVDGPIMIRTRGQESMEGERRTGDDDGDRCAWFVCDEIGDPSVSIHIPGSRHHVTFYYF